MEPIGREIKAELSRFGAQAGMPELLERWPEVVGAAIARNAWPARISRDGTVQVATADSVWAFELGQQAAQIATRLGVPAVRFAPGRLPEEGRPEDEQPTVVASPEDDLRAAAIAGAIGDESLRKRVQKAVALGLARGRDNRPI